MHYATKLREGDFFVVYSTTSENPISEFLSAESMESWLSREGYGGWLESDESPLPAEPRVRWDEDSQFWCCDEGGG